MAQKAGGPAQVHSDRATRVVPCFQRIAQRGEALLGADEPQPRAGFSGALVVHVEKWRRRGGGGMVWVGVRTSEPAAPRDEMPETCPGGAGASSRAPPTYFSLKTCRTS